MHFLDHSSCKEEISQFRGESSNLRAESAQFPAWGCVARHFQCRRVGAFAILCEVRQHAQSRHLSAPAQRRANLTVRGQTQVTQFAHSADCFACGCPKAKCFLRKAIEFGEFRGESFPSVLIERLCSCGDAARRRC